MEQTMFVTIYEDQVETSKSLRTQLDLTIEESKQTVRQHKREQATRMLEIRSQQKAVTTQRATIGEYREAQGTFKNAKDEAVAEKDQLQQKTSAMSENYKDLYLKNQVMYAKLVAIAEAGAFGGTGEEYKATHQLAKGTALEDLDMSNTASD
jgi:hypothetical protein